MQMNSHASTFIVFSRVAAIAVALVGVVVLMGWWLNIAALKSVLPTLVSMKPNTAFSFLAAGTALFLLNTHASAVAQRRAGRLLAAGVATIACLTLVEYVGAIDLGIDQLMFTDDTLATSTSHPGRMAPVTAICLALIGLALFLMDWSAQVSRRIAIAVLILATLGFTGYALGVKSLYQVSTYTSIALHTTVTLMALSLGTIAARPTDGCTEIIASDTSGGLTARRLLLLIPVLLFSLGWLTSLGRQADWYDDRFSLALVIVSGMAISSIMIIGVARVLNTIDLRRQQAQAQLAVLNRNLEQTVAERTRELEIANHKLATEIVERQHAEEEVRRLSVTDELTGLLNRRGFLLLAEQDIKVARRANAVQALFFIDLDGLKHVNDTHGHKAGDAMLKDAAQVLKASFRDADIVARLGGDEFAILAANGAQTEVMLGRMRASLEQFNRGDDSSRPLSFSTGVVLCQPTERKSILELLADADALMYAQKQERRLKQ